MTHIEVHYVDELSLYRFRSPHVNINEYLQKHDGTQILKNNITFYFHTH